MRKILFRAFILCTLIPSMWLSAANAVSEDAQCLSLENDSGAIFSVCLEGDVSKAKLTNKMKSEILGLAHQLKKGAVTESAAKKSNFAFTGYIAPEPELYNSASSGSYGGDSNPVIEPELYNSASSGSYGGDSNPVIEPELYNSTSSGSYGDSYPTEPELYTSTSGGSYGDSYPTDMEAYTSSYSAYDYSPDYSSSYGY